MKKIIIALISSVIVFSLMGCMPTNAEQLVNVNTADEPKADNIKATDYENNLNGLEKYLKELDYRCCKRQQIHIYRKLIKSNSGVIRI